jgi:hypothetical protein
MQALKSLSNRCAAHAEICGHGPLAEPGSSRDIASEDLISENLVDRA